MTERSNRRNNNHPRIYRHGARTIMVPINILCPRLTDHMVNKEIRNINLTELREKKMEVEVFLKDGSVYRW